MMTQEEYMDVLALARQGWTITQIAEALGRHPATVGNWLRNGGPPAKRHANPALLTVDDHWRLRVGEILKGPRCPSCLPVSG